MQVGKTYILQKNPFIHNGVIIQKGARVTVLSVEADSCTVQFLDKHDMPHSVPGIRAEELGRDDSNG